MGEGRIDIIRPGLPPARLPRCRSFQSLAPRVHHCSCVRHINVSFHLEFKHRHQLTFPRSEQLIPMFGLVALEHHVNPQTTFDKALFLIEYGFTHFHQPTAIVSFGALLTLILLRSVKNLFKNYPWIYRIPEVLLVVIVSTSWCPSSCHRKMCSY